ncbi:hypothetical protein ACFFRR_010666 [Megaselia abdita]
MEIRHLLLMLLFPLLFTSVPAVRRKQQVLNKCCRLGEFLDQSKQCVAGNSELWVPRIYMINQKKIFEPQGSNPKFFTIEENKKPEHCHSLELFGGSETFVIFSNATLFIFETNHYFSPENYCVDKEVALICIPKPENDSLTAPRSKVRKCCQPNQVYDETKKTCVTSSSSVKEEAIVDSNNVEIIYGFPSECSSYAITGEFHMDSLDTSSGNLTLNPTKNFTNADYCLEHAYQSSEVKLKIFTCSHHFQGQLPVNGSGNSIGNGVQVSSEDDDNRIIIYSIGLFISVIFLAATLLAGVLKKSNHHLLHWQCLSYYVGCLLVGELLLALTQNFGNTIQEVFCSGIASLMHFTFLAAFFWLNTMCFNIWWTFSDFRPTTFEKKQIVFRSRLYMVYAWGVPLILTSVALIMDRIPKTEGDNILRPRFGEVRCWFVDDLAILAYFFGPVGVLLIINILLFLSTARQLTCGLWKHDDVKSTSERAALGKVCIKLVIVMGITWIADLVSWIVKGPQAIWYVTDVINALQGVFIFIVVGCPQIWVAVKHYFESKSTREANNTMNGNHNSSSCHNMPSVNDTTMNTTTLSSAATPKIPMETVC